MPSAKLVLGGAGAAALGVRVARSLHGRWWRLPAVDRLRLAPLAGDAKECALEVRGAADQEAAERKLRSANESLAAALIELAESDPEIDEIDVQSLRDDLRRELERIAGADISASRGSETRAQPGG